MASRFLRASGNWSDPVWAATSSGAAGSATTPTAGDTAYINNNYSVTLDSNVTVSQVFMNHGELHLGAYKLLSTNGFTSSLDARVLNLGSGTLEVRIQGGTGFLVDAPNLNFTAGTSTVIIDARYIYGSLAVHTHSRDFNDFIINLGDTYSLPVTLPITGNPTFRSLIIQSKNSAAHTVQLDTGYGWIGADKLILIGSSASNKLSVNDLGYGGIEVYSSSYGRYVAMGTRGWSDGTPLYIGSDSTDATGNWLTQDPPKISTLVDPLTTAPGSNPNWTVSGTVTQVTSGFDGGGYYVDNDGVTPAEMLSADTYDMVGSEMVFQAIHTGQHSAGFGVMNTSDSFFARSDHQIASYPVLRVDSMSLDSAPVAATTGTAPLMYFYKIKYNSGNLEQYISSDGSTFTKVREDPIDEVLVRSVRISSTVPDYRGLIVGSINPSLSTEVTKTQDGRARISRVVTSSRQSQSRISKTINSLQTAISYIVLMFTNSQDSVARVQKALTSVQGAISNVRANFAFSRGSYESLPVDDSDLAIPYNSIEVSNVSSEDGVYTSQGGSGFVLHEYKMYHNLDTATITVEWVGKSTVPCNEEPVYLQIYNYDAGVWVTLDSDGTSGAGASFELTGAPSGNNGDYYDPDGFIAVRVYQ